MCYDDKGSPSDKEVMITTLIREVAGWRSGNIFRGPDGNPWGLNDRCSATNMHPDLQARIAREMEKA